MAIEASLTSHQVSSLLHLLWFEHSNEHKPRETRTPKKSTEGGCGEPVLLSVSQGESHHQHTQATVSGYVNIWSKSPNVTEQTAKAPASFFSFCLLKQKSLCCIKYEMGIWTCTFFLHKLSCQIFGIHNIDPGGKKKRDRKENSFAKGSTLVIKFQAKSPVHGALSFASFLNMHEFILHE